MGLTLTQGDAKLITDTMAGMGKNREYISPNPDLCFDVSKGIMKFYTNLTPTLTIQALLTGLTTHEDYFTPYGKFAFTGRGMKLEGTISKEESVSSITYDRDDEDPLPLPFFSNHALLSISKIIGQPGVEYCFVFHPHGLLFERENNVCYLTIENFFKIEVDRMKVSKSDVLFENSACDSNQILISRSKKRLF